MVLRTNRARNLLGSTTTGLIEDYLSDSEGEFVEEEKPWPPVADRTGRPKQRAPRRPRPHSHLFRTADGRRARGNKHARRWENSMYLSSLHQIPEEEREEGFTIVPPHSSPFAKLFTSDKCMQIWCSFTSRSEEEQQRILSSVRRDEGGQRQKREANFRRIERRIRSVLQHNKHLPLALMRAVEEEISFHFSLDHAALLVFTQTSPFYRLLLHGICQYLDLTSTTEVHEGMSLVVVECRANQFVAPDTTLVDYLEEKR